MSGKTQFVYYMRKFPPVLLGGRTRAASVYLKMRFFFHSGLLGATSSPSIEGEPNDHNIFYLGTQIPPTAKKSQRISIRGGHVSLQIYLLQAINFIRGGGTPPRRSCMCGCLRKYRVENLIINFFSSQKPQTHSQNLYGF